MADEAPKWDVYRMTYEPEAFMPAFGFRVDQQAGRDGRPGNRWRNRFQVGPGHVILPCVNCGRDHRMPEVPYVFEPCREYVSREIAETHGRAAEARGRGNGVMLSWVAAVEVKDGR